MPVGDESILGEVEWSPPPSTKAPTLSSHTDVFRECWPRGFAKEVAKNGAQYCKLFDSAIHI